jgi:hypothetical protein
VQAQKTSEPSAFSANQGDDDMGKPTVAIAFFLSVGGWTVAEGWGARQTAPTSRIFGPLVKIDNEHSKPKVTEVPEDVVKEYKLDTTFYTKHIDYKGFSILSSAKVSDAALLEAQYLIDQLLCEREDILKAMITSGCRFMGRVLEMNFSHLPILVAAAVLNKEQRVRGAIGDIG